MAATTAALTRIGSVSRVYGLGSVYGETMRDSRLAFIAALGAVVVMTALFALGVGVGAASGGIPAGSAMVGSVSLGLYAAALIGIGVGIGGVWRTSLPAEVVALLVVATYLIDLLAPPLSLPDWFHQLALTAHLGQPMIGQWDVVGVAACLVLAVGGVTLGAWGMARRDMTR